MAMRIPDHIVNIIHDKLTANLESLSMSFEQKLRITI